MTVGSAAIHKAINSVWDDTLDSVFQAYWSADDQDEFLSLEDQEAAPSQPFPYCVYNIEGGTTTHRMSGGRVANRFEIHDVPVKFIVHARTITDGALTAKALAASLAEEIIKRFGGHPTEEPEEFELDNGAILITQYRNDFGVVTGADEFSWIVLYNFRLDIPMAA